ncbi:MAG: aminotransferase class III-fold pyridoxal phosphate-dependent enzyme [Candidatus Alcyoniella australis]|nr:aminotransferase class III-fold pyridoxal phosphate-dependent enzyme [Candidatus Alcyoniella australis]
MPESQPRIDAQRKKQIEKVFGRHVNLGQVKYLKAGHLDVLETQRKGVNFTDPLTGREFIDCFTSAGCFNVGRHNEEVMRALDAALDELDMGSFYLPSEAKLELARRLVELAPGDLSRVLFAAGGGDAVDCAIKLARGATGRPEVISTIKGYHGHTGFALSANGKEHYRDYCEPLIPGFKFAPFNNLAAIKALVGKQTAAIIVEPIQGEAGIFVGDDQYLRGLRRLCDEHGCLLIFDEIQTGFGRTGKLWACEHSGVIPDVMTLAKSIGAGLYPNAAVLYRPRENLAAYVEGNPQFHISYSGGTDLGCRVSLAVIDFIVRERLWENAERQGAKLREVLEQLMAENPKIIKQVRGKGLMIGIEYIHEFLGPMMSDALAQNGVFAAYSGNAPQVMRFMAPIVINDEQLERLIVAIRNSIDSMKKLLPLALPAARVPALLRMLNNEQAQIVLFGLIRRVEDAAAAASSAFKGGER